MSQEVPVDDIPDDLQPVPAGDMPGASGRYVVEPNALQRRSGIRRPRFKDESLAGNVGRGFLTLGEDVGRETTGALAAGGVSPAIANAAGFVADAGTTLLPIGPTGKATAAATAPALNVPAKYVMGQALNATSRNVASGNAAKAIDTLLEQGVPVSAGGAAKLRTMITDLKREVAPIIAQSGNLVNANHVYKELSGLLDDVGKKATGYAKDQRAVMRAWDDFKNHPSLAKFFESGDEITIQAADKMKRASQKAADRAYGSLTGATAADEAQMAIARGLKTGMEHAEPAIAPFNAKMSEYINALEQLEPRAASFAKNSLAGMAPAGQSAEATMIMLADRNPWLKSYIAHVLYGGKIPSAAARTGVAGATTMRDE